MSESFAADPRHPVARSVVRVRAEVGELADLSVWSMDASDAGRTLLELTRLQSQVAELQLRVLAHAASVEVGGAEGATSTANWWAHHTRTTRAVAHREARLATALGSRHRAVRDVLATGDLRVDQAQVIVDAVAALPADLDASVSQRAEDHLIELARAHDAKTLRILGRHVLDVIAPEIGEPTRPASWRRRNTTRRRRRRSR